MAKKSSELAKQIQKEHEDLKEEMDSLQKEIKKDISADNFKEWRLNFLWKLRDFKNEMLKHFDLEELSEFPDDLLNLAPHYLKRFDEIKTDHKKIVIDIEEILRNLKSMNEKDLSSFKNIREKIINLISFIHTHEAAERELLEDTYLQDYGAND
jgi:hypothetical protein